MLPISNKTLGKRCKPWGFPAAFTFHHCAQPILSTVWNVLYRGAGQCGEKGMWGSRWKLRPCTTIPGSLQSLQSAFLNWTASLPKMDQATLGWFWYAWDLLKHDNGLEQCEQYLPLLGSWVQVLLTHVKDVITKKWGYEKITQITMPSLILNILGAQ